MRGLGVLFDRSKRWSGDRQIARRRFVAASAGGLLAAATVLGSLALPASPQEGEAATASASDRLPCTKPNEPANFRFHSLGPTFNGHPLTAVLRRCETPYPAEVVRANYVSYIYGTCSFPVHPETGLADGGCAPPVEIQTWPACERAHADYTYMGRPYPQEDIGPRRGVPATLFDAGSRLELYSGKSTIVIFANDPSEVSTAVDAVRMEPKERPPGPPLSLPERLASGLPLPSENLPRPAEGAMAGELPCQA